MRLTPWRANQPKNGSAADQSKLNERLAKLTGGPVPTEASTPVPAQPAELIAEPAPQPTAEPAAEGVAEPVLVGAAISQASDGEAPAGAESAPYLATAK